MEHKEDAEVGATAVSLPGGDSVGGEAETSLRRCGEAGKRRESSRGNSPVARNAEVWKSSVIETNGEGWNKRSPAAAAHK